MTLTKAPKKKSITHFLGEPQVEADARKERERRLSRRHSDDLSRSESFSESLGVSSRTTSAESAKYVSRIESCDFSSLHWDTLWSSHVNICEQYIYLNTGLFVALFWYRHIWSGHISEYVISLHTALGKVDLKLFQDVSTVLLRSKKSLQNIIYAKYCMSCYSDILPKLHSNWQNLWQDNVKLQTHGICLKKRHADAKVLKEDTQPAAISWVIVGLFGQKAAWAWSSTSQSLMRKHGCCGWCTRQNWGMMTSMTCYISIYDLRVWMIWDELKTMILGVAPESRKCQCRQVYFSSHRPPVRAAPPPQMPSVPKTDAIWSVEWCKFSCGHLSTCMKQDPLYGDTCCIQINAESNRYRYSGYSRYQCWVNASEPDPQSCYGRIPTVAA